MRHFKRPPSRADLGSLLKDVVEVREDGRIRSADPSGRSNVEGTAGPSSRYRCMDFLPEDWVIGSARTRGNGIIYEAAVADRYPSSEWTASLQ